MLDISITQFSTFFKKFSTGKTEVGGGLWKSASLLAGWVVGYLGKWAGRGVEKSGEMWYIGGRK